MAEEMRLHLEQRTEENIAAGLSPVEARYAAERQFGGIEQIKEAAREQRGIAWIEHIGQDLRFGARMLRKQPGFAAVAILTLALGIGATTAIFSVVNGVLLRPLGYPDPHELMLISETSPRTPQAVTSPATYHAWSQQSRRFARFAAWNYGPYNLTGEGTPRRIYSQRITAGYFGVLGVRPALGRDFLPGEDTPGKDKVAILSHALWMDQFGGRPTVIGQPILLDDQRFTVVGVMAESFLFDRRADIYTPTIFTAPTQENISNGSLLVLGRLKPGITAQEGQAELAAVSRRLAAKSSKSVPGGGVRLMPLQNAIVSGVRTMMLTLLGAVASLLLIACVNVANLLLARASTRQREIAVRVALGAGRGRILRQLLSESLLIALLGGGLGILAGYGGMHLLLAWAPVGLPRLDEISMDGRVLAFASILSVCTGIGFGLAPAIDATGVDAVETLKDGGHGLTDGRRRRRLRTLLVVLEVALALILLTGAGLLGRSFLRLQNVDPGFHTRDVYMSNIVLIPQKYPNETDRAAFVQQAIAHLAAVPGISAVAFTNHTLPTMGMARTFFAIAGRPPDPMELPPAYYYAVTPEYFKMMNIPLIRGRILMPADVAGAPRVALINQEMAKVHFPDADPIGQHISVGKGPEMWREIVGIVGDVRQNGLAQPVRSQIYEPLEQSPSVSTSFIVQTTRSATELPEAVRAAIHDIDKDIPVTGMYPVDGAVSRGLAPMRFVLFLFTVFALTALGLAAIGVYAVMTYVVNQRTGEIGIRMALGAQRSDVLWLVFREGGQMVGVGLLVGLAGTFLVSKAMGGMLFQVSPYDPLTLAAIATLLAVVAFIACWLPARRATRVNPLVALRCE